MPPPKPNNATVRNAVNSARRLTGFGTQLSSESDFVEALQSAKIVPLIIPGAAIDVNGLAGDEAAVLADEEEAGGGDLVDLALTPDRDACRVGRAAGVPFGIVAPCVDAARRDDVDADIVRREFRSEPAREADQRHLGGREVGAAAAAAGIGAVADEEQDAAVFVLDHLAHEGAR